MAPAIRPASSEASPRGGDTVCASDGSNDSGSEPYLSTPANCWALGWLNCPEISVVPKIGPLMVGAETTCPSSTNAAALPTLAEVYWPQPVAPSLLKVRLMTQPTPWVFCWATALSIWVPSRKTGPSTYFSVPSWLQATSGRVGSS